MVQDRTVRRLVQGPPSPSRILVAEWLRLHSRLRIVSWKPGIQLRRDQILGWAPAAVGTFCPAINLDFSAADGASATVSVSLIQTTICVILPFPGIACAELKEHRPCHLSMRSKMSALWQRERRSSSSREERMKRRFGHATLIGRYRCLPALDPEQFVNKRQ
ncbi:hypothetical protein FA95DRAFT_246439 [Auriscalpium vulgare]|uniref:Uncharacterized protein n=1 Tax=Auriscalpium vulgare TaxID=40419 RepID=A0ACB8RL36_9AGAM|nr:hypothetical protein FA95DRAFT_246439 [Auriscalpium vulgare]